MIYVTGYIAALIAFGAIDAVWLRVMGPALYRPTLGDILLTDIRLAPAVTFYAIYPVGLLVFAVMPALKSGSTASAVGSGLLFGAIAYATYDLTNFATLRNWTLQITLLDIAYGAAASAFAAFVSLLVVRAISPA
jgi:uncharacterized membrane protein